MDFSHLEQQQQEQLEEVLNEMKDVFSENDSDIGDIQDFQMPINLTDDVPVTAAYRRIPPHLYKEVKTYIDDLIANGWVRESMSSYSSPIVVVRKKDGSMRMCVDYRALNLKTVPDAQPIPRIQDILDTLHGQQWFSTLDMSKAYHQGYIGERFRHLTAFATPWTLLEWIRIPFGLRNAPPAFQRYINLVLGDLKGSVCEPYLDDILVYGRTFGEQVKNLKVVLKRLRARGIKLRANKCVFAKKEVRYLGRLVSGEGYRPDPTDTVALEKFREAPKTVGELRSLLGFFGYYRAYVQNFSKKMKPLYALLATKEDDAGKGSEKNKNKNVKPGKKGQKYDGKALVEDWSEKHQEVVNEMIDHLQSPQVMAYPNFEQPFFITTDASHQGLGCVLYQTQDGIDRVISYASRTLSDAEKNYHMHSGKLEFLGLKWAVTERFADYLRYGSDVPFLVYTDNNPLTYVLTTAKLNAVGMRWVNELADFNFSIKYRPGKENVDSDYLSRRSMDIEELKAECTEQYDSREIHAVISGVSVVRSAMVNQVSVNQVVMGPESPVSFVSSKELIAKQKEDVAVGPVYQIVSSGRRPSRKEWAQLSKETKRWVKNFNKLSISESGVLIRKTVRYRQLVLPQQFHNLVYVELHEQMGHLGAEKVIELAQQRFYWPGMATDITNYIQKRCRCIANKKPNVKERAPLVPMIAQYPFEMVAIDYMKLDKCKGGFEYAMVVTDHFTRFCQIYATKSKSSKAAADKLFNQYIMQFGWPTKIHSDRGGEFTSKMFEELHRLTGIVPSKTTPWHPQGNGKAERFNRTVCNMLKTLSESAKKDWKSYLPKLAFAYNCTVNKTTKFSPFQLMFGREGKLPIDFMFEDGGDDRSELRNRSHEQFVKDWGKSMEEACRVAKENMGKAAGWNKRSYDKKAKAAEIVVGDKVLMQNCREKGGTGKLRSYWEENVFEVVEKKSELPVYKIRNINKKKDERVVHRNLLMLCNELPADVFKDVVEVKVPAKSKEKAKKKKETVVLSSSSEESDLEDVLVQVSDENISFGGGEVAAEIPVEYVVPEVVVAAEIPVEHVVPEVVVEHATNVPVTDAPDNEEVVLVADVPDEVPVHVGLEEETVLVAAEEDLIPVAAEEESLNNVATEGEPVDVATEEEPGVVVEEETVTESTDELDDTRPYDYSDELSEGDATQVSTESEEEESSPDEESSQHSQREVRSRKPAKVFAYDTLGGNPVLHAVKIRK